MSQLPILWGRIPTSSATQHRGYCGHCSALRHLCGVRSGCQSYEALRQQKRQTDLCRFHAQCELSSAHHQEIGSSQRQLHGSSKSCDAVLMQATGALEDFHTESSFPFQRASFDVAMTSPPHRLVPTVPCHRIERGQAGEGLVPLSSLYNSWSAHQH